MARKSGENRKEPRENHVYINFHKKFVGIIDYCVAHLLKNGANKYTSRKDFVIKAIQNQLEREKLHNIRLRQTLARVDQEALVVN